MEKADLVPFHGFLFHLVIGRHLFFSNSLLDSVSRLQISRRHADGTVPHWLWEREKSLALIIDHKALSFPLRYNYFFISSADVSWISCCSCTKFPRFSRLKAILLFHSYYFNLFSLFNQDEIEQTTLLSLQSLVETLAFHPLQHLCTAHVLWFLAEFFYSLFMRIMLTHVCGSHDTCTYVWMHGCDSLEARGWCWCLPLLPSTLRQGLSLSLKFIGCSGWLPDKLRGSACLPSSVL